ncbi:MAG: hypothetical protein ACI8WB_002244 [Phenylobacterium sp.]|jgi:hypothetical protein
MTVTRNKTFKQKPLDQRRKLVRLIIARLLKAYGLDKPKELVEIFNCTYGAIKNWGSSGRVPLDPLFQCHFETGVSLDWLMNGKAPATEYDQKKVDALTAFLNSEMASGVRYKLIEEKCDNGVTMLSEGLSASLLDWMDIKMTDNADMPSRVNHDD